MQQITDYESQDQSHSDQASSDRAVQLKAELETSWGQKQSGTKSLNTLLNIFLSLEKEYNVNKNIGLLEEGNKRYTEPREILDSFALHLEEKYSKNEHKNVDEELIKRFSHTKLTSLERSS